MARSLRTWSSRGQQVESCNAKKSVYSIFGDAACNGLSDGFRVASDHCDSHAEAMKLFDCLFRFGANFVFHGEGAEGVSS